MVVGATILWYRIWDKQLNQIIEINRIIHSLIDDFNQLAREVEKLKFQQKTFKRALYVDEAQ